MKIFSTFHAHAVRAADPNQLNHRKPEELLGFLIVTLDPLKGHLPEYNLSADLCRDKEPKWGQEAERDARQDQGLEVEQRVPPDGHVEGDVILQVVLGCTLLVQVSRDLDHVPNGGEVKPV